MNPYLPCQDTVMIKGLNYKVLCSNQALDLLKEAILENTDVPVYFFDGSVTSPSLIVKGNLSGVRVSTEGSVYFLASGGGSYAYCAIEENLTNNNMTEPDPIPTAAMLPLDFSEPKVRAHLLANKLKSNENNREFTIVKVDLTGLMKTCLLNSNTWMVV